MAIVVQLLGTVDDLVAPEDNLDLVTGREFVYLDVPRSGHVNVIEMDSSAAGEKRRDEFRKALVTPLGKIKDLSVEPSDRDAMVTSNVAGVTDVVFVIHGIRDGAKALYPNAVRFSYIGHSNGTYLLASALRDNPACRFDRVVFAGSVVRKDYDWAQAMRRKQVGTVLNYVATNDKIVACFPGALERLRWDLGSAGHNGFVPATEAPENSRLLEVRFVEGGHSAALSEEHWEAIAQFICEGRYRGAQEGWRAEKIGGVPW